MIRIFIVALFFLLSTNLFAQDGSSQAGSLPQASPSHIKSESNETDPLFNLGLTKVFSEISATGKDGRDWTSIEIVLSVGTLFFTIVVLILETIIILKAQEPWSPQSILRVFGLTLILSMSVLLIAAGYSKDQTAPVLGLLGVIAGYLLGNNESNKVKT